MLLRNAACCDGVTPENYDIENLVITVTPRTGTGPALALVGLQYRGNIGAIIRHAVQANFFKEIYIVNSSVSDEDRRYYSCGNAELVPTRQFENAESFLHFVSSHGKEMVCVDTGHDAVNIEHVVASP